MTELPACKFRGEILGDKVECSCPSLIQAEQGKATIETCLYPCPYRDEVTRQSPPLHVKAVNFLTALAKHAIAGFPVASEDAYKERLDKCMACDRKHPVRMECTECGCDFEEKAAWAEQECPLKKWLKVPGMVKGRSGCGSCGQS
jgi:hypothetical protein